VRASPPARRGHVATSRHVCATADTARGARSGRSRRVRPTLGPGVPRWPTAALDDRCSHRHRHPRPRICRGERPPWREVHSRSAMNVRSAPTEALSSAFLSAFLDALADRLTARINGRVEWETFSSRELPPRTTRRRFAEVCKSGRVEGARREGRDWICSRTAWEQTRTRRSSVATRRPMNSATSPTAILDARADALLARAGLRVIGGGS
jgi:hypothetical protein